MVNGLRKLILVIGLFCLPTEIIIARSIHRPQEDWLPSLQVSWEHEKKTYTLTNGHLQEYPFFQLFDAPYFDQHLLPLHEEISFRYDETQKVLGNKLHTLVNHLLDEINAKKKSYTDFIILQNKDFNRRKACGLIVLKFKNYPFVLKLFLETPQSFTNPQCKGFDPIFFFYMGGGVNRHLAGFTRLKNLYAVNKHLTLDSYWQENASTPRKWFWLSEKCRWFTLVGHNFGTQGSYKKTRIPATYGIIADAIEPERHLAYHKSEDRSRALALCNFLGLQIDPNIRNFIVEKETGKLVIVDTEHFPTIVGLSETQHLDSYFAWFSCLINKCAKDMLFSTKKDLKHNKQKRMTIC